ncbi:MAG TPA: BrnT family toxin [Methylomirabilota bacterium]
MVYVYYAYTRCVEFEWDEAKRARNRQIHGVDFEEAATAFFDPLAVIHMDEVHSRQEHRFRLLSRSRKERLLVTIFADRGQRYRIISSRPATRRETRDYEKGI